MSSNPQRRKAWRIVAIGGARRRTDINPWREAAQRYRERAINLAVGLDDAHRDLRTMQEAFNAQDDQRPLAGDELQEYVTSLRQRCETLWMHSVDLERERDAARTRAERYARDKLAHQVQVVELQRALEAAEQQREELRRLLDQTRDSWMGAEERARAAEQERDELRPVAQAAVAWIDAEPKEDGTELDDLIKAVDAYHRPARVQ